jgi:hypothetical protein
MSEQTAPETPAGELPAAGETSPGERTDTRTPDASGTLVTITEAAERFEVSAVTLRRKLKAGEITGAAKRPGPKGDEWLLPLSALESLGYSRRGDTPGAAVADVAEVGAWAAQSSDLIELADRLASLLEGERLQLRAAENERTEARAEAAAALARLEMTEAERDRERQRAETLAAEIESERTRATAAEGERDRLKAEQEAHSETLAAEIESERGRADALAEELEQARKRRRLFRRK